MLHTLITLLSTLLGHLIGDPVHKISALAIKSVMNASAALDQHGATAEMSELVAKIEAMSNSGRAVTEQEWIDLKTLADKHLSAIKTSSAESPPAIPTSGAPGNL